MSRILFLAAAALFLLIPPAAAQDESHIYGYNIGWHNKVAEQLRAQSLLEKRKLGYITPDKIQVEVIRTKYMEPDQFGLRLRAPDVISGCYDVSPLEYEANFFEGSTLEIKVTRYRRTIPDGITYAHTECPSGSRVASAMIVLSKQDLQKRGIHAIRFTNSQAFDTYKLNILDNTIELIPDSMNAFKTDLSKSGGEKFVYAFYPQNTLRLQVPMSAKGDDLMYKVRRAARGVGLTPLDPASISPDGNKQDAYLYTDPSGAIAAQIDETGPVPIGTVEVNRPYNGPNGQVMVGVPLTIYADRAGVLHQ